MIIGVQKKSEKQLPSKNGRARGPKREQKQPNGEQLTNNKDPFFPNFKENQNFGGKKIDLRSGAPPALRMVFFLFPKSSSRPSLSPQSLPPSLSLSLSLSLCAFGFSLIKNVIFLLQYGPLLHPHHSNFRKIARTFICGTRKIQFFSEKFLLNYADSLKLLRALWGQNKREVTALLGGQIDVLGDKIDVCLVTFYPHPQKGLIGNKLYSLFFYFL